MSWLLILYLIGSCLSVILLIISCIGYQFTIQEFFLILMGAILSWLGVLIQITDGDVWDDIKIVWTMIKYRVNYGTAWLCVRLNKSPNEVKSIEVKGEGKDKEIIVNYKDE